MPQKQGCEIITIQNSRSPYVSKTVYFIKTREMSPASIKNSNSPLLPSAQYKHLAEAGSILVICRHYIVQHTYVQLI